MSSALDLTEEELRSRLAGSRGQRFVMPSGMNREGMQAFGKRVGEAIDFHLRQISPPGATLRMGSIKEAWQAVVDSASDETRTQFHRARAGDRAAFFVALAGQLEAWRPAGMSVLDLAIEMQNYLVFPV